MLFFPFAKCDFGSGVGSRSRAFEGADVEIFRCYKYERELPGLLDKEKRGLSDDGTKDVNSQVW